MHPYIVRIPLPGGHALPIASYGALILAGFLLGLWLSQGRARRLGLDPAAVFDVIVVALLAGLVGARLLYVVQYWHENYAGQGWRAFAVWQGGLSFFGGFVGGALGLIFGLRRTKLAFWPTVDVAASLVPLGHAFGRLGCFMEGCCYGKVTHSWLGVRFPRHVGPDNMIFGSPAFLDHLHQGLVSRSDAWSLPVYPTQLYEAAANLVIFALLSWFLRRRHSPGQVAGAYLVLYGGARYWNEFLRGDHEPMANLGGMTAYQAVAALACVAGFVLVLWARRRPSHGPAESRTGR